MHAQYLGSKLFSRNTSCSVVNSDVHSSGLALTSRTFRDAVITPVHAPLTTNLTLASHIFLEKCLNHLAKSQIPIFPHIPHVSNHISKSFMKMNVKIDFQ